MSNLKGGFFFFFASFIVFMGIAVFFLVPETKGKSLEAMDQVFGTAYGDLIEVELRDYRMEVRKERDFEAKGKEDEAGKVEARDEILRVEREMEV